MNDDQSEHRVLHCTLLVANGRKILVDEIDYDLLHPLDDLFQDPMEDHGANTIDIVLDLILEYVMV
jgi:hypothetical protein